MTNQMVTYNGINTTQRRTIATTTKRKQSQLEALETAQADYYEPLTVAEGFTRKLYRASIEISIERLAAIGGVLR